MGPLDVPLMGGGRGASIDLDFLYRAFQVSGFRTSNLANVPGVSISRSSVGYAERNDGTLQLFQANEARITDKGLLVEEARTNLLLRSQEFSSASWGKSDTTVTADQAVAPDGTTTGDLITEGSAGTAQLNQAVTITAGTTYSVGRFFKRGNTDWVLIKVENGGNGFGKWYNLSTGALGNNYSFGTGTYSSASITAMSGGWYWCVVTGIVDAASTSAAVRTFNTSGNNTEVRVNGATRYEWQADWQAGSFMTSPIVTTSASATRAADNISVGGLSVGGAFAMLLESNGQTNASQTFVHARLSDGTTSNYAQFAQFSSATQVTNQAVVGGVGQVTNNGTIASGAQFKTALMYDGAGRYQSATGGTLGTAATGKTGFTGSLLGIGSTGVPGNYANTYLRRVVLYPRAFSDAELIAATQ